MSGKSNERLIFRGRRVIFCLPADRQVLFFAEDKYIAGLIYNGWAICKIKRWLMFFHRIGFLRCGANVIRTILN